MTTILLRVSLKFNVHIGTLARCLTRRHGGTEAQPCTPALVLMPARVPVYTVAWCHQTALPGPLPFVYCSRQNTANYRHCPALVEGIRKMDLHCACALFQNLNFLIVYKFIVRLVMSSASIIQNSKCSSLRVRFEKIISK